MTKDKKYILQGDVIAKKLKRLALEVIENNIDEKELIFVGVQTTGVIIARWLQKLVRKLSDVKIEILTMDIDKQMPKEVVLSAPMDFNGKVVVLIDDVTNSGKTLLYAMKPFLEFHPKKIQTLVLVERSHTQFPVNANYKGVGLATTLQEHIVVEVEGEMITGAYLA